MSIDAHDCVGNDVVDAMYQLEILGREQYQNYVKDVLVNRTSSIHKPIKKHTLPLFKGPHTNPTPKSKQETADIKSDYGLFSQLYIASQARKGDLNDFFCHENHPWPPALSEHGIL